MTLINCFKNPDQEPSPRSRTVNTDIHITIGGQPVPVSRSRRDEMAMRVAAAVEAHRIAMREEREHRPSGGWSGWVTSEGRAADFPRVELTPHHPEQALLDRTEREDRSDLTRYRLTALQGQLTALQRPLNAIATEAASIARDGVGSWTPEQVDALVRIADLEAEVGRLLTALRERF